MNRQAFASALRGGGVTSGSGGDSGNNASVAASPYLNRTVNGVNYTLNTAGVGAGDAEWYPTGVEWNERYAPGKTITQEELDRLLKYAIKDEKATYSADGAGTLYLPDLGLLNGVDRPNDAMGLSYEQEWTPIEGFTKTPETFMPGDGGSVPESFSVNGKNVAPVKDVNGVLTGYRTVAPASVIDGGEVMQPDYKEEFYATKPTGNYVITDGVDRYERDIVKQWENDAKGDGFGDFFSVVAPIALSFALGPAGLNLGGTIGSAIGSEIAGHAISGAISGGLSSAITGGDVGKGILTGAVGGGIGGATSGWSPTGISGLDSAIRGGVRGLATGAINGNAGTGLLSGAIGGGMRTVLPGDDLLSSGARSLATGMITRNVLGGNTNQTVDAAIGAGASYGSSGGASIGQVAPNNEAANLTNRQKLANQMRAI